MTRVVAVMLLQAFLCNEAASFWDTGTTTIGKPDRDVQPRQSFFRWQWTHSTLFSWWFPSFDWEGIGFNRKQHCMAGISIDLVPLGVAVLLNRRVLLTSANYMEPHMDRQRDLRIWALGRAGLHRTPYRYRVWRVRRLFPRSNSPEHWHGRSGDHVPRHDVAVIHSFDQIYIMPYVASRYSYAFRATLPGKRKLIDGDKGRIWFAGSGHESLKDIRENYKIKHSSFVRSDILDCSKFLPKWWGKFICINNKNRFPGLENGAGLFVSDGDTEYIVGIGCFEIRYNEDRTMVFTDLRYYIDWIHIYANITPGDYYEYAYPKWFIRSGWFFDSNSNDPYIPSWHLTSIHHMYPLG